MKFVTLFFTCLCVQAFGQDYIVTTKGDTLRGEVKILFQDKIDRAEVKQGKKKTNLQCLQIRALHYKNDIYNPIAYNNTIRFMKLLKPGYLRLYAYRLEDQYTTFGGRYLLKMDGTGTDVPSITFRKIMMQFLADDPALVAKIEDGTYGRSDISKIIDEYNANLKVSTQNQMAVAAAAVVTQSKIELLDNLRNSVKNQPEFPSQKDALDLMDDMKSKLSNNQSIPRYMIESLKGFLATVPAVTGSLDKFTASLTE